MGGPSPQAVTWWTAPACFPPEPAPSASCSSHQRPDFQTASRPHPALSSAPDLSPPPAPQLWGSASIPPLSMLGLLISFPYPVSRFFSPSFHTLGSPRLLVPVPATRPLQKKPKDPAPRPGTPAQQTQPSNTQRAQKSPAGEAESAFCHRDVENLRQG